MNNFMARNRNFEILSKDVLSTLFHKNIDLIARTIGNKAFRIGKPLNAAAFDGVMVGLAERLKNSPISDYEFIECYNLLIEDEGFISTTKGGTSDERTVEERIKLSIEAFE